MVPLTTFSGTGLDGIETSVMMGGAWAQSAANQGAGAPKRRECRPLERRLVSPISPSCRPLPVFRNRNTRLHTGPARWRAGYRNSRSMEDLTMRSQDLTPFYRSTVGFDRLFSLLDQVASDGSPGYPPYNIERTGENAYRITVAVSGFAEAELSLVAKENTLTIKGEKVANENGREKSAVLYRGIAARA